MARDHRRIYQECPGRYDALMARRRDGVELLPYLMSLGNWASAEVLEVGVGTGRTAELLLAQFSGYKAD